MLTLINFIRKAFVFIVKSNNTNNASLIQAKLQLRTEFTVKHFAGDVTYDAVDFVERNADNLPDFLIGVVSTSTNELVAQELHKLVKYSNEMSAPGRKKSNLRSVIDKFSRQLHELMKSIQNSQTRYIKCIKPCDEMGKQKCIEHNTVINQLKCAGLVTAIELSRDTFPNKMSFRSVDRRFACLLPVAKRILRKEMQPHDRAQFILSLMFAPLIEQYRDSEFDMPFSCGYTKAFFRSGALESLETMRHSLFTGAAIKIQQWGRKVITEMKYRRMTRGFTRLQAVSRSHTWFSTFKRKKIAATTIQAGTRCAIYRAGYLLKKDCVREIELWWTRFLVHARYRRMQHAAKLLAAWTRMQLAKEKFRLVQRLVLTMQAKRRAIPCRELYNATRSATQEITTWWKVKQHRVFYLRKLTAAFVLSNWIKSKHCRIRFTWIKMAAILIQSKVRARAIQLSYNDKMLAAKVVTVWAKRLVTRRHHMKVQHAATRVASWFRSKTQRAKFSRMKQAVTVITSWKRSCSARCHFKRLKDAANSISRRRRGRQRKRENSAASQIQAVVRSHLMGKCNDEYMDSSNADKKALVPGEDEVALMVVCQVGELENDIKFATCAGESDLLENEIDRSLVKPSVGNAKETKILGQTRENDRVPEAVVEQLFEYKKQIEDLSFDLMNVTAEAELHKQEVEAEFEERLIEYEEEVLQLRQCINSHEKETQTLKAEIAANVENIRNLKKGIRSMQESHREYLNKVMRAIENATTEHRKTLDEVRNDRDSQVAALQREIRLLTKLRRKSNQTNSDGKNHDIHTLARKLEKLTSPDYIASIADMASAQEKGLETVFEARVSSKARSIIYQLEDLATSRRPTTSHELYDGKECIQFLQQQLVIAYEEIETLRGEASTGPY